MLMALSQPACIKKMFLEVLTFESRFAVEMRLKMHQEMIFLEVILRNFFKVYQYFLCGP